MIAPTPGASSLTLDEQAALTAGTDLWHTPPIERLGVPALRLTDGPNGARGERWSSGGSAVLPCGSTLGATWNRALVRRVGRVLADEARAKGAQVLLAPTVNLHRHPLGGRHFECYSEDPLLTAELSTAYILGVQERGIAAVVKHFVCNDQEVERHTISVEVDERTLRELYLVPFEAAVRRAGVWGLMGAYNRLDGVYCCEHRWLLDDLLRDEWAFDGVVMSDWYATHSTAALAAGLDLEMPGPATYLGPHAAAAARSGALPESAVERAAERMLRLIDRVTGDGRPDGASVGEDAATVAREAACEAIVLLKNDPIGDAPLLPLDVDRLRRVALIGPLARRPAVQGGGSAEVTPAYVVSPLEALRARLGPGVELTVEEGSALPGLLPLLDRALLGAPLRVTYFATPNFDGAPLGQEEFAQSRMIWSGAPAPGVPAGHFTARLETVFVPDRSATWRFGLSSAGQSRLLLDGRLLVDNFDPEPGETFFGRGSTQRTGELDLAAGTRHTLVVEFRLDNDDAGPLAGMRLGAEARLPADAIERAARAAAAADVALVIAGYDAAWESESVDRPHLHLPGEQDRLIDAVAAANRRTIVAVNAGAPVGMDWADQVPALLQLWFPGMELGNALLDVLGGDTNPSGHLPTSFPFRLEDTPAFGHYPGTDGVLRYAEGVFIGYRHYLTRGIAPRFCFGHGLSYTQFEYTDLEATVADDGVHVRLQVRNAGQRAGQAVVQLYVRDVDSPVERPDRELREFAKVLLQPGEIQPVPFTLSRQAFAYWDVEQHAWHVQPGAFDVLIGASAQDIRMQLRITL